MSKKSILDNSGLAEDYVSVVTKLPENVDLHAAVIEVHKFGHTLTEVSRGKNAMVLKHSEQFSCLGSSSATVCRVQWS